MSLALSDATGSRWVVRGRAFLPGVTVSAVIAAAAAFLGEHYSAPVMLFALLLGMAMNFLSASGPCMAGIEFTARHVLRIGVALLGLRITVGEVSALGVKPLLIVVISVAVTILLSILVARCMGFRWQFGLLTGGATAICGVSAALALAAVLPASSHKERATSFTVIGVSALSTVAMISYPALALMIGLDVREMGIFLGGTIHDVAQVVGAGYSVSREAGDTATVIKLMRVAMLLPVIVFTVALYRLRGDIHGSGKRPPLLPLFVAAFAVLVAVNSLGWISQGAASLGNDVSRGCLVAAIAAIGMKTHLKELSTVGLKPIVLMVGETVFLAGLVLALLRWMA